MKREKNTLARQKLHVLILRDDLRRLENLQKEIPTLKNMQVFPVKYDCNLYWLSKAGGHFTSYSYRTCHPQINLSYIMCFSHKHCILGSAPCGIDWGHVVEAGGPTLRNLWSTWDWLSVSLLGLPHSNNNWVLKFSVKKRWKSWAGIWFSSRALAQNV